MHLGKLTTGFLQVNHKRFKVEIYLYKGEQSTEEYTVDADYDIYPAKANIQVPNQAELKNTYNISISGNLKEFVFDKNIISGLNRNLRKGADWIKFRGLMYQVSFTIYEALDDFVHIIGIENVPQNVGINPVPKNPAIESPANSDIFNM